MMVAIKIIGVIFISYVLGSVPFGYIFVRVVKGVDIRRIGSGNIGATNAARAFGPLLSSPASMAVFVLITVLDMAKGFVPTMWFPGIFGFDMVLMRVISGLSAIIGHNWSIFMGFRGGRGVNTSAGVFLALAPEAVGVAAIVWIVVALATRYVSLASILSAVGGVSILPILGKPREVVGFGALAVLFVVLRHRSNIKRLIEGTELRIGEKAEGKGGEDG